MKLSWLCSVAFLAVMLVGVVGCQPKVVSPITGKEVTAEQLVVEADKKSAALEREAAEAAATAAKRIKDAQREAKARFREIEGSVETTVADARRVKESIAEELEVKVDEAEFDFRSSVALLEDNAADLDASVNAGLAEIEAKRAQMMGIFSFVKNIPVVGQGLGAAGLGDLTPIATLLLGGGVASWSARRGKDKEDKAWDEAQTKMKEIREAEARDALLRDQARQIAELTARFALPSAPAKVP